MLSSAHSSRRTGVAVLTKFLWYADRFSLAMTARTTKTALVVGLVYGTLQDVAGVARGRRIGYVEWFRKQFRASDQSEDLTAP